MLVLPSDIISTRVSLPQYVTEVELNDIAPQKLSGHIDQLRKALGPISGFLHLHPFFSQKPFDAFFNVRERDLVKCIYFIAKNLAKDLTQSREWGRPCFMAVTRLDGMTGIGQKSKFSPLAGGFYGLTKTLNLEWSSVFCRSVDFHPDQNPKLLAKQITSEIYDPDLRLLETAYINAKRYTVATKESVHISLNEQTRPNITPHSVFFVSGGARGVTAACVLELAKRYRCQFILLGRSELLNSEPAWAKDCFEDSMMKQRVMEHLRQTGIKPTPMRIKKLQDSVLASRSIVDTIRQIERFGAKAVYISGDITKPTKLKQKLIDTIPITGPITGIIHGAGVLADKRIENKTEQDYDSVFQTKIVGLDTIFKLIPFDQLRHLILFASTAGFYGNEAQSDYALANEVLNKTAYQIKLGFPDCHVVAFNWGPWDSGMVTPQLKEYFKRRNITVIPTEIGTQILANELHTSNTQHVQLVIGSSMLVDTPVSETLKKAQTTTKLFLKNNPIIRDHSIGGDPVLPMVFALSWMTKACEQQFPGFRVVKSSQSRVLNGIILKDQPNKKFSVAIYPIEATNGELTLEVSVSSKTSKGFPIFHYKSEFVLSKYSDSQTIHYQLKPPNDHTIDVKSLYQDGTLFHGPSLQIIKKINRVDETNITINCSIDHIAPQDQGQFPVSRFNHFADDSLLQAVVVWARNQYGNASLPLKINEARFINPVPFDTPFCVSVDVSKHNASKVTADIVACDPRGKVYTKFYGVEITLSKTLNAKFLNR